MGWFEPVRGPSLRPGSSWHHQTNKFQEKVRIVHARGADCKILSCGMPRYEYMYIFVSSLALQWGPYGIFRHRQEQVEIFAGPYPCHAGVSSDRTNLSPFTKDYRGLALKCDYSLFVARKGTVNEKKKILFHELFWRWVQESSIHLPCTLRVNPCAFCLIRRGP